MVLFALSAFGCTVPHYLFGQQLMHANKAFYGGNTPNTIQIPSGNPSALVDAVTGDTLATSSFLSSPKKNDSIDHLNLCRAKNEAYNISISDKGTYIIDNS